jgi:hypothetical protein
VTISGPGGEPEKVLAATCSSDLFGVLGISPGAGRAFVADDDLPGGARVAILGHGLWQRRFGGDPSAIGRELLLDGAPTLIVGVMPAAFDFPAAGTELWVPLRLSRTRPPSPAIRPEAYRQYRILNVVARLRPGATVAQARSELTGIGGRLEREYPDANHGTDLTAVPLQETVVGAVRTGAAPAVRRGRLRAAGRLRERRRPDARACGRTHAGGDDSDGARRRSRAAGTTGAHREPRPRARRWHRRADRLRWALNLLVRFAPGDIPRLDQVRIDGTTVVFTFLTAVAAGLLFGVAPAFQVRAQRLHDALLASGRGLVSGSHQRARQLLVVAQIALSLMLLVGAVLLAQSFTRLQRVDAGFSGSSLLFVDRIELPRGRASAATSAAFFSGLIGRLREIPVWTPPD